MGVKVRFLREEGAASAGPAQPAVLVPKAAVRTAGSESVVFVVRGAVVEERAVRIGGTDGDKVEVVSGLQSGERVVAPIPEALEDGAAVTVKQQ